MPDPTRSTPSGLVGSTSEETARRWVGRRLAEAAREACDTEDWFITLGYARDWNMDDWCAVGRRRGLSDVLRNEALSALYIIEAETVPTARIRGEKCTTPVPHDREDCNGW